MLKKNRKRGEQREVRTQKIEEEAGNGKKEEGGKGKKRRQRVGGGGGGGGGRSFDEKKINSQLKNAGYCCEVANRFFSSFRLDLPRKARKSRRLFSK